MKEENEDVPQSPEDTPQDAHSISQHEDKG
jgi:hypothetical protein